VSPPTRPQQPAGYVFDASSLIKLEKPNRLSILADLSARVFIPYRIAREINTPRTDLERWLSQNHERVTHFLPEEHELYYQFYTQTQPKIHDGEAAALAVALNRGATLVIDDNTAKAKAESHGIYCLSVNEFLDQALY